MFNLIAQRPIAAGLGTSALTLLAGLAALVLADFGGAWWMFVPLLAWLLSVGLPTTLAVLLAAALWGRWAWLSGLGGFIIGASVLAAFLQCVCFLFLARLISRPTRTRAPAV
jgi:hypothetical protein